MSSKQPIQTLLILGTGLAQCLGAQVAPSTAGLMQRAGPIETLPAFISALEKSEQQLRSIHIVADCEEVSLAAGSHPKGGDSATKAQLQLWRCAYPGSLIRVDFDPLIVPFQGGGHSRLVTSCFYDGVYTYLKTTETGLVGKKPSTAIFGQVLAGPKGYYGTSSEMSAWTSSIYGFYDLAGTRLSSFFKQAKDRLKFSVTRDGIVIVAHDPAAKRTDRWVFDAKHGYALRSYRKTRDWGLQESREVLEYLSLGGAGFYPREVRIESHRRGRDKTIRHVRIKNAVANPRVCSDPRMFTPEYPEGSDVYDFVTGRRFIIGPNEDTLRQRIDAQVARVRKLLSRAPRAMTASRAWLWWSLFLVGTAGLGVWMRRRQRKSQRMKSHGPKGSDGASTALGVFLVVLGLALA